ncbi:hypothetical protein [Senegalia sp. (in: firmicutes)]|uniref:hypothetical protein n=1 Tax=Senegalia sp. (in: firmicutes) TaxID=1924098 RepID=UPI003F961AE1
MKIYNKKGFISGITFILISIFGFITMFLKGFSIFYLISGIFLFLFGITEISRSFSKVSSKEDKLEEDDERNTYIRLKAGKKSFQISKYVNIAVLIILTILFAVTKNDVFAYLIIIPGLQFNLNLVLELATYMYYGRKV